jgi:uncharacterized protein
VESAPSDIARPSKSALAFFLALMALYVVLGGTAQAFAKAWGLAWTEVFVFFLPAVAVAAGSNLRPGSFLLLSRRPTRRQVALGALSGGALFLAASGILSLTTLAVPRSWVEAFDVGHLFAGTPRERAGMAIVAAVLAPFAEEVAFRGYVLSAVRTRVPAGPAIAASAVLFAAMHLDPVRFPAVAFLGCWLGWLAVRSGSLWPAVAAHGANNALGAGFLLAGAADPGTEGSAMGALAILGVGAAALVPIAFAWIAATPGPPAAREDMVPIDPAVPSIRFRLLAVPVPYLLAAMAGLLLYAGMAALHLARG